MELEVFKTGIHTDSAGNTREWTEGDLDHIAKSYNPANHEAPVVIGHPKDNAPAFGWVEALKRNGNVLVAKLKDLNPEFVDMVKSGAFKKRSIALLADNTLRHIGFLGAMPPAVKGLKDATFKDIEAAEIEFTIAETVKTQEPDTKALKEGLTTPGDRGRWTPPDRQDFSELAQLREKLKKIEADSRKKDFTAFCNDLIGVGKLTPAQKPTVVELMEVLHTAGTYEFSEYGTRPTVEAFKDFLSTLHKQIEFAELATKKSVDGVQMNADVRLGHEIADSIKTKTGGDK